MDIVVEVDTVRLSIILDIWPIKISYVHPPDLHYLER